MTGCDAIVVGACCAGSVLAARLASAGWKVLLAGRATGPGATVSTHVLFPHTLARRAARGVMGVHAERLTRWAAAWHGRPRVTQEGPRG